ncbi:hypothetical protein [Actinacidiphila sp. bgisy167]
MTRVHVRGSKERGGGPRLAFTGCVGRIRREPRAGRVLTHPPEIRDTQAA